ncbi:hypothetical protein LX15_004033 [Streptoalloteichus tenebrarius]|uniref:Lipoprotein n=1 Tax=Streptoalloteichus tenebrarius (strain ATCC 17920 / DSM 40477 / JCM 4838 / CBS 697.72 / NBRC 16177 / NCIMB 11028 / NRRL B-12390 / A12253. 1 / ISP 5477) TaxID=1933 RepID=A0ABT1HXT1_STRSD|nr:hypothetical protein [Streptoalloteichus tenebrarius]MCP2260320.1 hypothetical protein [Streptoalloteichus tenebrarius]BFF03070.1 hypothetical protein GCM10020241_47450 [Streptoalloteichus tenebrarius]
MRRGVRGAVGVGLAALTAVAATACTRDPALRLEGVAPSSPAARPSAVPPDPTDIRTVDLRSILLADPGVGPLVKQAVLTCDACGQEKPTYVDLTGDHVEDAVVIIRQPERRDVAALYVYSFQRGEIRQIFSFFGNDDLSAQESNGDLVVRHHAGAEVVRARWDGLSLSVVERSGGRLAPTGGTSAPKEPATSSSPAKEPTPSASPAKEPTVRGTTR